MFSVKFGECAGGLISKLTYQQVSKLGDLDKSISKNRKLNKPVSRTVLY